MVRIQQEIDRDRAKAVLISAQSEMLIAKHKIMKHILDELKEEMESLKKKQKEMVNVEGEDEEEKGDGEEEEEEKQ
ncbi:hypothetical protein INT45_010465 [Circinella minor]|uniref:Uncharacterized protein n=1 Tax=Circinella minor TaxID=1195481 RepID=A0A8H7RKC7_9FUNG|nr:hypothetical protein INT45_010465 [Circinella minor]